MGIPTYSAHPLAYKRRNPEGKILPADEVGQQDNDNQDSYARYGT
jgi:hypothetical protein